MAEMRVVVETRKGAYILTSGAWTPLLRGNVIMLPEGLTIN